MVNEARLEKLCLQWFAETGKVRRFLGPKFSVEYLLTIIQKLEKKNEKDCCMGHHRLFHFRVWFSGRIILVDD